MLKLLFLIMLVFILSSFAKRMTLAEYLWFSDDSSTGYAFFDYGTVSYMQGSYGFSTSGTLSQRILWGFNRNREDEAFTVTLRGSGWIVLDAIIIDFPYLPSPNETLFDCN